MPMTLNVGVSRKVGEANFSSRGASINLAIELEGSLISDPSRLRGSIRQLFDEAREAVDEELSREETNGHANHAQARNGGQRHGNGHHPRPATQAQVKAIHAIARRQRLDLDTLLSEKFGCTKPEDLSLSDASSLIDELNGATQNGGRR